MQRGAPCAAGRGEAIASPPHAVDEIAFPNHLDDFGVGLHILHGRSKLRGGEKRRCGGRAGGRQEGKGRERGTSLCLLLACCSHACVCVTVRVGANATGLSSRNPPCSIAFFTVIERVYQSRYLHFESVAQRTATA